MCMTEVESCAEAIAEFRVSHSLFCAFFKHRVFLLSLVCNFSLGVILGNISGTGVDAKQNKKLGP